MARVIQASFISDRLSVSTFVFFLPRPTSCSAHRALSYHRLVLSVGIILVYFALGMVFVFPVVLLCIRSF